MKKNYFFSWVIAVLFLLPASFATAQVKVLDEGFESGFPTDWTQDTVSGSNGWSVQTGANLTDPTGAKTGNGRAYFTTNNNNPSVVKLVSPVVDASALYDPVLTFHYAAAAFPGPPAQYDSLRVYYRTTVSDVWTLLKAYGRADFWTADTISLIGKTTATFQVAFEGIDGSGHGIVLDDIAIQNYPRCVTPTNLRTLNVIHNSARLLWSGIELANYSIKVDTVPITDFSRTALFEYTTGLNNYILPGLSPSTDYYFYIKSNCVGSGESNWSSEGRFKTGCAPVAGLNDDFENYDAGATGAAGFGCWSAFVNSVNYAITDASYPSVVNSTAYAHSGNNSMQLFGYYSSAGSYTVAYAVSPRLADSINLSEKQLSFNVYASSSSIKLHVAVAEYPDDISSYVDIQTVSTEYSGTKEKTTVFLNEYTGTGRYIVFYINGLDAGVGSFFIDDVVLEPLSVCSENTQISGISVTPAENSALIKINAGNTTNWNLKVSTVPIDPTISLGNVLETSTGLNPYTVTNLNPVTIYYIYVQPVCNGIEGVWSAGKRFQTLCPGNGISTFPYQESFDIYGTGTTSYPACWSKLGSIADIYIGTTSNTAPGALYLSSDYSGVSWSMGISPKLAVSLDSLEVTFNAWAGATSYSLAVGAITDPDDLNSFVPVQTVSVSASTTWQKFKISFANYTGTAQYIAFYANRGIFFVDDVSIERVPVCNTPVALTSTGRTENSVSLAWTSSGSNETAWELVYGPTGFNPDDPSVAIGSMNVTTNSATVPSLSPATYYDFYVRTNCGGTDGLSLWSSPLKVMTKQIPATFPYSCNFEVDSVSKMWTLENGTQGSKWVVGSATNNGGSNSLYISSDKGKTNSYANSVSYTYAYRTFNLEEGYYDIHFDWKANGQTTLDLLNVFLVPGNIELQSGNAYGMESVTNTSPGAWINISGGILNAKTVWSAVDTTVLISAGGDYHLVFFWKNDAYTDNAPAAAVDNITLSQNISCMTPIDVRIKEITDISSVLSFTSFNATNSGPWSFKLSTTPIGLDTIAGTTAGVSDRQLTSKSHVIDNLQANTVYYYYLKAACDPVWVSGTFRTRCRVDLPYTESFDTYGTGGSSFPTCWLKSQNIGPTSNFPYIVAANFSAPGSLYFSNNATTDNYSMAVAPLLNVDSLKRLGVTFKGSMFELNHNLIVGAISDPEDINTFVPVDTVSPAAINVWEDFEVYFDNYTGDAGYVAFLSKRGVDNYFRLDDVKIDSIPDNRRPQKLQALEISTSSALLIWEGYGAGSFNLKVSSVPLSVNDSAVADVFDGTVNSSSHPLPELNPASPYYFYVQAVYSGALKSDWSKPGYFYTLCPEFANLPYKEDFDGSTAYPSCWSILSTAANYPQVYASNPSSAPQSLYFSTSSSNYAMAITPALDFTTETGLRINFKGRKNSSASTLIVGMIADPDDRDSFEAIATISPASNNTWQNFEVVIDSNTYQGDAKHVAFMSSRSGTNRFQIDDIIITPAAITCFSPVNLISNRVTYNSARIAWNSNGTDEPLYYRIKRATRSIDPAGEDVNVTLIDSVFDNYYYLNDLTPATTYYCYVQAVCGDNDLSYWSEELIFRTSCTPFSLPFADGFGTYGGEGSFPSCWRSLIRTSGTVLPAYQYEPYITTNGLADVLYLQPYYSSAEDYTAINVITPEFDVDSIQKHQLSFRYASTTTVDAKLYVGVMSDWSDASTFVAVDTFSTGGSLSWYEPQLVNFRDYTGNGKYVAFRADGGDVKATYTMLIDTVSVLLTPDCAAPYNIRVKSTSDSTATIGWKSGHSSTSEWEYVVTNAAIRLTSENALTDIENAKVTGGTTTNTQAIVTGLQPNTTYYFYIKSTCGTYYPAGVGFTTACASVHLPYLENFDGYGTGTAGGMYNPFPPCWTRFQDFSTTTAYPYLSTAGGNNSASLYFYNQGTGYTYNMAISPELDVDSLSKVQVRFRGYASDSYNDYYLVVGVIADPSDTTGFVAVDTVPILATGAFEEYAVSLATYNGDAKYIAFLAPGRGNHFYIDDLVIEKIPLCQYIPGNLQYTERGQDSISISWTGTGEENQWEIAYGARGFSPESAAALSPGKTYTASGLNPNTAYDFYVRTVCGIEDGAGSWRGPLTVNTLQIPADLPYSCDFETGNISDKWTLENGYQENKWFVDTATHNGGAKSLYISSDNGLSNTYNDVVSHVYAYRTLKFAEEGLYDIGFDWKANGRSAYEYASDLLNVFFVPDSIELKAGDNNGIDDMNVTPDNWINVSGGALNQKIVWSRLDTTIHIRHAGNYQLVFFWKNKLSGNTNNLQPPAAVDNVSVSLNTSCMTPLDATIRELTDVSATLNFTSFEANNSAPWTLKISTRVIRLDTIATGVADVLNTEITTTRYPIGSILQPETTYYYYLKSNCGSEWVSGTFKTLCAAISLPYSENFDSYQNNSLPACWTSSTNLNPYVLSPGYNNSAASFYFYNLDNTSVAISPRINIDSLKHIALHFKGYTTISINNRLIVGVISDPTDWATFVAVDTVSALRTDMWEDYNIYFDGYSGSAKHIAFLSLPGATGIYLPDITNIFRIDNLLIDSIPANRRPENLKARNITGTSALLTWKGYEADSFHVKVSALPLLSLDNTQADIFDGYVTEPDKLLTVLSPAHTYYFYVRGIYGNTPGEWSKEAAFRTGCPEEGTVAGLPFRESFDMYGTGYDVLSYDYGATVRYKYPDCWLKLQYLDPEDYLDPSLDYPYIAGNSYNSAPASLRIIGFASSYSMAISPELDIDPVKGFRLNLKGYSNISSNSRLVLGVISDPEDVNSFTAIDTLWIHAINTWQDHEMIVDTTVYKGTAKRIAFFSSVGIAGNYVHIDDVNVNCVEEHIITDVICKGYPYRGHGFDIPGSELNTAGVSSFRRFATSPTGCDSTVVLQITVGEPTYTEFSAAICEGGSYTDHGFVVTASKDSVYTRSLKSFAGCDSILVLNLTVHPKSEFTESVTICPNAVPYTWHGQSYNNTGVYYDSLTTVVNGCDSVYILNLTIRTAERTTLNENICFGKSFELNGKSYAETGIYLDTLRSVAGCDSIITLNLTVNPVYNIRREVSICSGQSFTGYGFENLTTSGEYSNTYDRLSVSGCDSIFTLDLKVLDDIYTTIRDTITEGEVYNENGFEGITTAGLHTLELKAVGGCDSIVQLLLVVEPVNSIFIPNVETFLLSPNPVERGNRVTVDYTFTPVEENGLKVEVFNSVGVCVSVRKPEEYPIVIDNLDTSGIYFVRIVTGTNKVLFGKVIVK